VGHRLSKIYTRTGDQGTTGLGDGSRIPKHDLRIEAIGAVDELNSHLGLCLAESLPELIQQTLTQVQHELFELGAELCIPGTQRLSELQTTRLEEVLDTLNAALPPLKEFILPRGSRATAQCHVARAVTRRAERVLFALHEISPQNPYTLTYVNRLSDLLFVMARTLTQRNDEILWKHD